MCGDLAVGPRVLHVQVDESALLHLDEFVGKQQIVGRRHRVHHAHVCRLSAMAHHAQHRDDRGQSAASGQEKHFARQWLGQNELTLGRGQSHDCTRLKSLDQVRRQETLGHGLDRDRDGALGARQIRHRGQRVRPPRPTPLDEHSDSDVLPGRVVERESPPRLDTDGGGVVGFRSHRHHLAAQFTRRPERIGQVEIVVGQQRRGDPRDRSACPPSPTTTRCHPRHRLFKPFPQLPQVHRSHSSSCDRMLDGARNRGPEDLTRQL